MGITINPVYFTKYTKPQKNAPRKIRWPLFMSIPRMKKAIDSKNNARKGISNITLWAFTTNAALEIKSSVGNNGLSVNLFDI